MNIPARYTATFALLFAMMLGWNAFLIVRDSEMFKMHQICQQFTYHPDCVK
jgi:hypothetical protein